MADVVLGRIGTVVREIRGGRMPGEIRVLDGGEPMLLMAFADDPVPVDARVRVLRSRGSRQVDVVPWP